MAACEHCWAFAKMIGIEYRDQLERAERDEAPCTQDTIEGARLRAGQWWDENTRTDRRFATGNLHHIVEQVQASGKSAMSAVASAVGAGAQHALDFARKAATRGLDAIQMAKDAMSGALDKLKSTVGDKLKDLVSKMDPQKFLDQVGFDPFKDLTSLTFAGNANESDKGLVIIHGKFNVEKIQAKFATALN